VETLMPPRHSLELFVTVTDFHGYRRDLVISDPPTIRDTAHRHVLAFKYGDGTDQFNAAHNGALAFAARSTMSFPGAFPPVSLASFQNAVRREADDLSHVLPGLFRIYELSDASPAAAYFVDGGVLDNKPFGHVIAAIKRRGAELEVDRRLLYLEPDPGSVAAGNQRGKSPSPIATVLASVSGLPRQEPLLDDIREVSLHNERVRRIADIIETSFESVGRRVAEIVGTDLGRLTADESPEEVARWRDQINAGRGGGVRVCDPRPPRRMVSPRSRANDLPPGGLPDPPTRQLSSATSSAPGPRRACFRSTRPAGGHSRPTRRPFCAVSTSPTAPAACVSLPTACPAGIAMSAGRATRHAPSSMKGSGFSRPRAASCSMRWMGAAYSPT
jgi:hypothetical protein